MTKQALFPSEVRARLPSLAVVQAPFDVEEFIAQAKLFYADGSALAWFIIAYDGDDQLFGWQDGQVGELGYFSVAELVATRSQRGDALVCDTEFQPKSLVDAMWENYAERRAEREALAIAD